MIPPKPLPWVLIGTYPTPDTAAAAARASCNRKANDSLGNTDTNVGGAPCPPGQHAVSCGTAGAGGSGGDSTANTNNAGPDCCEPDTSQADVGKQAADCCDKTASGLESIGAALAEINKTLNDKLGKAKNAVELTFDEIIAKLREKFETGVKSCDECTTMLQNGMGGTIEYAIQCAGACVDKAKCECSMGDESCWDKPCESCGEACCVCNQGICEPTDCKETPPKHKFIAWCSPLTGSIAVTEDSAGPPGAGFFQVAIAETEQAAAIEGAKNCSKQDQQQQNTFDDKSRKPIQVPDALCNFDEFISGKGAERITSNKSAANAASGVAEASNAVLKFGFEGVNSNALLQVVEGAIRSMTGAVGVWSKELLPTAIAAIGCSDSVFTQGITLLSSIDSIAKMAQCDLSPWTDQIKYVVNARCRQQFMNPDQALAAYLANSIDYRKLDGHWAIANICNESLNSTIEASKAKPVPIQLAIMRRRKLIDSGGYQAGMRRLGYLESGTAEQLFQLTEQVPPMSDIIRFMVRDADDSNLVAKFGLDAKFDEKYQSGLKEWAEFQGIPEKIARYNWRAHWGIPSPGQLFVFYQRLRDNPQFGGRDKVLQDVKDALIQQDILPFWHDHYLATSFHPMGRIDIRRAFNIGAMVEDELEPAYRQLGYSDETASKLAKFSVRLRNDAAAGHRAIKLWHKFAIDRAAAQQRMVDSGLPSEVVEQALSDSEILFASSPPAAAFVRGDLNRQQFTDRLETVGVSAHTASDIADQLALKVTHHSAIKGLAAGAIEESEAKQAMLDFGMSEQVVDNIVAAINSEIDYAFLAACQKGIKRRYLSGEFDAQEATTELVNRGTSMARANKLVDNWSCERVSTGKSVPTNRLCDWLGRGVISSIEFAERLVKLGHTEIDAARIRDDCLASISLKRQNQAAKEAKQQTALEQREQAAMRRAASAARRAQNQYLSATNKAAHTRAMRQKQFLSAAVKISKKCDCDLYDSEVNAKAQASRVQREYGLTIDESLQLIIKSAEAWQGGDIATYQDTVTTLALGLSEPAATATA
jgi:hypothetical protein